MLLLQQQDMFLKPLQKLQIFHKTKDKEFLDPKQSQVQDCVQSLNVSLTHVDNYSTGKDRSGEVTHFYPNIVILHFKKSFVHNYFHIE